MCSMVAPPIELLARRGCALAAAGRGWNDRFGALIGEKLALTVGVVGVVGNQALDWFG